MNPVDSNLNTNPGAGSPGGLGSTTPPTSNTGDQSGISTGSLGAIKDSMEPTIAKPGSDTSAASTQSDEGSAALDVPEAPFIPAAPVPGSIGSVTSGPTTESTNLAAAVAPSGADGSAAFAPVSDTNPTMPPVGNNNDLVAQAANETPAATAAFNPFAAPTSATPNSAAPNSAAAQPVAATVAAPTTAANGPAAGVAGMAAPTTVQNTTPSPFQAKMDSLAARNTQVGGKKMNPLTIILAVVSVLAIVAAIAFFVLWRQEAGRDPEIRYITAPTADNGGANAANLTCSRMYGAGDIAGMDNLINAEASLALEFTGDEWQKSALYTVYNFTDAEAAAAADAGIFAAMTSSTSLNSGSGEAIVSASSQALDNRVEYQEETNIALMDGAMADSHDIPRTEDGAIQRNRAEVQSYYEGQGWSCK